MKKVISTPFDQKRKTLYKRNVLGTFFRPESQKRDFPLLRAKSGNVLIFRFWRAFGAKNAPERKSGPKSEKSAFGRFGLQKRVQMLMFFTVWRSERK